MNTATKVFIILNLLFALGFAYMQMLTYATRENWKRRWDQDTQKLAGELSVANALTANASHDKAVAEAALERANFRIAGLATDVREKDSEISDKEKDITNLKLEVSEAGSRINAQVQSIKGLNDQLVLSRQRQNELNNIAAVAKAVAHELDVRLSELEDDFNNAQVELARREDTVVRMEQEVDRKDARLALVRDRFPKVWEIVNSDIPTSADVIEGMVAAIHRNPNGEQDLVVITVGRNAKVEQNMEFIILRGDQYIVKVRVDRVLDDMAACRVIPETWNTRGHEISEGDKAQNKLW